MRRSTPTQVFAVAALLAAPLAAQVDWLRFPIPPAQSPPERNAAEMEFVGRCGCVVVYSGWSPTAALTDMWRWDGVSWTLLDANAPPGMRWGHAMSADRTTGRLVLFGGARGFYIGDTWEWDGVAWTQLQPPVAPSPRAGMEMVFDEARGVHVLFSGGDFNGSDDETWEWNGVTWTLRNLAVRPSARGSFGMAYDRARAKVVLFGGELGHGNLFGDTWEYDGTAWTQRFPATSPRARSTHEMIYDDDRGRVVLYGGMVDPWTSSSIPLRETWEWDGNDWLQRSTTATPAAMFQHEMTYDAVHGVTVAFGGATVPGMSQETWLYYALNPADVAWFGSGCASGSSGATPALDAKATAGNRPWLGAPFTLEMTAVPPGGQPLVLFGLSRTAWAGTALPASLGLVGGGPGCLLHVAPAFVLPMPATGAGVAEVTLPLPVVPAWTGRTLFAQGLVLEPATSPTALTATNALQLRLGAR